MFGEFPLDQRMHQLRIRRSKYVWNKWWLSFDSSDDSETISLSHRRGRSADEKIRSSHCIVSRVGLLLGYFDQVCFLLIYSNCFRIIIDENRENGHRKFKNVAINQANQCKSHFYVLNETLNEFSVQFISYFSFLPSFENFEITFCSLSLKLESFSLSKWYAVLILSKMTCSLKSVAMIKRFCHWFV